MKLEKMNKNRIGIVALLLIVAILFSCSTEKKTARKEAWLIANNKLPEICANNFKIRDSIVVKDSVSIDTISVKENYIFDTLYVDGDTIYRPGKIITHDVIKTITKTNTVFVENTSRVAALTNQLNELQKDRNEAISKKDKLISDQQSEIKDKSKWKLYFFCLLSLVIILKLLSVYLKSKKKVISPIDIILNSRHQG